jgi:hypothetical protein
MKKTLGMLFCVLFVATAVAAEVVCKQEVGSTDGKIRKIYYQDGKEVAMKDFVATGDCVQSWGEVPDGVVREYFSDGQLKYESSFVNNKREGAFKRYYSSGKLHSQGEFLNGQLDGEVTLYNQNGGVAYKTTYQWGSEQGTSSHYNEKGKLTQATVFAEEKQGNEHTDKKSNRSVPRQPKPEAEAEAEAEQLQQQRQMMLGLDQEVVPIRQGLSSLAITPKIDNLKGRMVVQGNIGSSMYSMQVLNDYFNRYNDMYHYYSVPEAEHITSGTTYQGGVEYWVGPNVGLGFELENLEAKTTVGSQELGQFCDYSALELGGYIKYGGTNGPFVYSVGLGLYSVSLYNASHYFYQHGANYYDYYASLRGAALGVKVFVSGMTRLTPLIGVGVDLGYRAAHIEQIKYTRRENVDERWEDQDGEKITADYSGFFFRAGLRLFLPQ